MVSFDQHISPDMYQELDSLAKPRRTWDGQSVNVRSLALLPLATSPHAFYCCSVLRALQHRRTLVVSRIAKGCGASFHARRLRLLKQLWTQC